MSTDDLPEILFLRAEVERLRAENRALKERLERERNRKTCSISRHGWGALLRRILGIDPGSVRTGYGILDIRGNSITPVAWGVIRTEVGPFPDRLYKIHKELSALILLHRPTEAAVEKVFLSKNAASALKLGQARGAAIVTCGAHGLPVHEYSAREIKSAATGYGAAPKEQVAGMVARLLGIREAVPDDASDALATAFCRAVTRDVG